MKVLITGGAGFLGRRLANSLLQSGDVEQLLLVDRHVEQWADERVRTMAIDVSLSDGLTAETVRNCDVIYHLAAVVSGEAEADFDLGMRVNIDGGRNVLEACRRAGHVPRVVFTSSVAVFGPAPEGALIDDHTATKPRSSYGMEKAVCELLLRDYARRGFIDGVVLRLPTISVRPGAPNRAASSFASGIIREPLAGIDTVCPVKPDTSLWLLSPEAAIRNLVHAARANFPSHQRIVNLPGLTVTVGEMVDTLVALEGDELASHIRWTHDPAIEAIVANWPARWDIASALELGFVGDADVAAIIRSYLKHELGR